jgi:hypothetical protein
MYRLNPALLVRGNLSVWAKVWLVANLASLPFLAAFFLNMASHPYHNDVYAFWNAWTDGHLYPDSWEPISEFVYSPAFAQVFWPLTQLPFDAVYVGWTALQFGALVWLLGPAGAFLALAWPLPHLDTYLMPIYGGPIYGTLQNGNPMILAAAAVTLGLTRWPEAWAFVALTKVSAGIGLLWFAFRRQWRAFGIALATIAAIVALSFLAGPALWIEWFQLLAGAAAVSGSPETLAKDEFVPIPLAVRGLMGVGVVGVAAWRGWPWLVPLGCFLALPDIHIGGFALLFAIPAIWLRVRPNADFPATD